MKRSEKTITSTDLLGEVLRFLREIELEPDEDSCMGMAFVTNRVSEDWYYSLMYKLEKAVTPNVSNDVSEGSEAE
jgi:hypothetical protein